MATVSRARRQRAHETETAVAAYFREHGWPYAEPVGAGRNGADITGTPGLAIEVKARRDLKLTVWLKQASKGLGAWPMVVHRPDGYGPERVADWPVTMRLADATAMLRQAGYGDELAERIRAGAAVVLGQVCPTAGCRLGGDPASHMHGEVR